MDTILDQLLDSPDNLEYLARQSRLLSVSPKRFLKEMGALSAETTKQGQPAEQPGRSIKELVAEALARLREEQSSQLNPAASPENEETAYDAAERLGLIGCVKDAPSDLSTNPKHLEGFGQ